MLSIISMNRAGLSDGCLSVKVDFEFDNASTLPERVVTVSGMSYIIAKDSTAKNTVTNVNYKYTGSKWVKVTETVEPVTGGTITDNGDYTITSNEYTGLSDISVDVADSSTFMDKTITQNNTYVASDDGVSGYSSVTVNVSGDPLNFQQVNFAYNGFDTWGSTYMVSVVRNELGLYDLTNGEVSKPTPTGIGLFEVEDAVVCIEPAVKIYTWTYTSKARTLIFTPSSEFVGIYNQYGEILVGSGSVTPGDNKTYKYYIASQASSGNLTKSTDYTFNENGYKIVK